MKEYLVIGNPIVHSLSPELHNYWIRENGINGIYNKRKLNGNDLKEFFLKIKNKKINGAGSLASALSAKAGLRKSKGCLLPTSGGISLSKKPIDHARTTTETMRPAP